MSLFQSIALTIWALDEESTLVCLSIKDLMSGLKEFKREDSWKSLGQQGDQTSQS